MSYEKCDVVVIGLGYVGLPTAALIARAGHRVIGVDTNESVVESLANGHCTISEPAVRQVVDGALADGRLTVSTSAKPADIFIVCVPTPVTDDHRAELGMVRSAIAATAPYVRKGNLVILESTSPIGTTETVIGQALRDAGLDPYEDVDVCYCPERVFPGETVREILQNDRVVGGLTPRAAERAGRFYQSFCEGAVTLATAQDAEFSKLMENTYRDVNIALANVFARVAEAAGADVNAVIRIANRHPRVNVHKPGPGAGGHCIPVDPWFLIGDHPERTQFLRLAREINDGQPEWLLNRAEEAGLRRGCRVAILGAAYRGDIDDARDTPTERLVAELEKRGYDWATHDPFVDAARAHSSVDLRLSSELGVVLAGAEAAIVMTDHSVYSGYSPDAFMPMTGRLIVDARNCLKAQPLKDAGFSVLLVGVSDDTTTSVAEGRGQVIA